jgi:two-component system, NarL family, nitrate/nitrite sensor histidine kinase NarX
MQQTASLSNKLILIGASLLVIALASIGLNLWVTWQLEEGAEVAAETERMRMQIWRLNSAVHAGKAQPELQRLVGKFDQSLAALRKGDASGPLYVLSDEQVQTQLPVVESLWQRQRQQWLAKPVLTGDASMRTADDFIEAIDRLDKAIDHHLSWLTEMLNLFHAGMMALAIGGAVIMLYAGHYYVIGPLNLLRRGLAKLESGEFATRIEVDTKNEFGQVAAGFNRMARTLESLYKGLESQVDAKTRHIEAQRVRLEALYEVSAFLARAGSIDELGRGFVQRVRTFMKADAGAVRWFDEDGQCYVMLASDCFPQDLLEEERSMLAGACGCGNLRPDSQTCVISVLSHDDIPSRRCAREGYVSMVSVPVRLQQRLLGEINLFFRSAVTLRADETELLDALASHLANALESLRAAALAREAAVAEERAILARELHDSIAQSLIYIKIQLQLLRIASQKEQAEQVSKALDALDTGLRESISDVRELLMHFRTRTNTDDIERALRETLQKFQDQTGLPTKLQIHGEGLPLPSDVQVQVLHVVQEALSNARKHAGATQVNLEVLKGVRWRFMVRDDGIGFDTSKGRGPSHVGMEIMRERASGIGAEVETISWPGQGTTTTLTLPMNPVTRSGSAAVTGHGLDTLAGLMRNMTPLKNIIK